MRNGLTIGSGRSLQFTVTETMVPNFDGAVIHPLCSTVTLVYYMEWASRKIIEPYLEDHEEGMGVEIEIKHMAAAAVGAEIAVEATVIALTERAIYTQIIAKTGSKRIAAGKMKQSVLPRKVIEKLY
ncbi:thioesterase family protein [Jeotgalibacillus proteolyticus]|uniref:Thioesterase n=1 Tax=Jeotgalibacillus proteolyticus TaxID=2082395 RepID=A0A2S5GHA2_9BACL|nr:thioesterase [Jeotgalibacillus proteolyticus]PPA72275.1 thioesterase [Jeotgalibacillus proteolyticus]